MSAKRRRAAANANIYPIHTAATGHPAPAAQCAQSRNGALRNAQRWPFRAVGASRARVMSECLMQCSAVPRALAGVSGPMDGFRTAAKSSAAALQNVARIAQVEAEGLVSIPPYRTRYGTPPGKVSHTARQASHGWLESMRKLARTMGIPILSAQLSLLLAHVRCARQNEHRCFLLRSA